VNRKTAHHGSPMTQVISLGRILGKALGVASTTPFSDDLYSGCHDGAAGVQWHIAADRVTGETWLAVNLEGLKYGRERPIAKLLQRELARPAVLGVLHLLPRAKDVIVHLTRDAWANQRQRVAIKEWTIERRPASELTRDIWKRMMTEGLECLGPAGARGRQLVTRHGAAVPEMVDVLPHFNAGMRIWSTPPSVPEAVALVAAAKAHLEPVHEVVVDRLSY
jgi:hypothetical protein